MWNISLPSFVKKEGQRIYWSTRINIMAEALKRELKGVAEPSWSSPYPIARPISQSRLQYRRFLRGAGYSPGFEHQSGYTPPSTIMGTEHPIANGKTIIEVVWSVSVSTSERFSNPKIESLNFIETLWDL